MRRSISDESRALKFLGRLAAVPGVICGVCGVFAVFAFIAFLVYPHPRPAVLWLCTEVWIGTVVAAIALGWFARRVRSGSTLTIGSAALTFSLGVLLLVVWHSDEAFAIVVPAAILAASSWWALYIARRLRSRFPGWPLRPHATRRLSLPRDARALHALVPALHGGLQLFWALMVGCALAPLLRQQALPLSFRHFIPIAFRHFRRVRAVLALRAQEVRLVDRRLPVLLLRSFYDDELAMQRNKVSPMLSLEEKIVAQLWEVGPVVAIGQPALETDPIGAARERIVGPLWQPRVLALIEESAMVAVVLGQTEGLFWEYEQLSRRRGSVLAILPPGDGDVLARWQRFTSAYPPARGIVQRIVSGQPRDEHSYELAFALWHQNRQQTEAKECLETRLQKEQQERLEAERRQTEAKERLEG